MPGKSIIFFRVSGAARNAMVMVMDFLIHTPMIPFYGCSGMLHGNHRIMLSHGIRESQAGRYDAEA